MNALITWSVGLMKGGRGWREKNWTILHLNMQHCSVNRFFIIYSCYYFKLPSKNHFSVCTFTSLWILERQENEREDLRNL